MTPKNDWGDTIILILFVIGVLASVFSSCGRNEGYDKGYDSGYNDGEWDGSHEAMLETLKQMSKIPNKTQLKYGEVWETEHFKVTFSIDKSKFEIQEDYSDTYNLTYDIEFLTQTLEESYQNHSVYFGIYSDDLLILEPDYEDYYIEIMLSNDEKEEVREYGGKGIVRTYGATDLKHIEVVIGIDDSLYVASVH